MVVRCYIQLWSWKKNVVCWQQTCFNKNLSQLTFSHGFHDFMIFGDFWSRTELAYIQTCYERVRKDSKCFKFTFRSEKPCINWDKSWNSFAEKIEKINPLRTPLLTILFINQIFIPFQSKVRKIVLPWRQMLQRQPNAPVFSMNTMPKPSMEDWQKLSRHWFEPTIENLRWFGET